MLTRPRKSMAINMVKYIGYVYIYKYIYICTYNKSLTIGVNVNIFTAQYVTHIKQDLGSAQALLF